MIYLAQVLSALQGFRSSVPISLIGGIVDRGFSENDIDVLCPAPLTHDRLSEHCGTESILQGKLHVINPQDLHRPIQPPEVRLGSALLWDFADKNIYPPDEFVNQSTLRHLANLDFRDKQILDVGCGSGFAMRLFFGAHPVGISTCQADVDRCVELGLEAYLMDQNILDFPDASFDIVWSHHTLEHSVAPVLAIRETFRVLKSPGVFALTVGTGKAPGHHYRFDSETLRNMLSDCGFTILELHKTRSGFSPEIFVRGYKPSEKANPS